MAENENKVADIFGQNPGPLTIYRFVDGKFRHIGSASLNEDDGYYSGRIQAENLQFGKLVNTFDLKSKTNGIVGGDVGFKIPTKKPENWNGEGTLSLTQGNVFSIPIIEGLYFINPQVPNFTNP